MKFSLATVFLGIAAVASALPQDNPIAARQNQGRPMPFGTCCIANTNLKQDACVAANGEAGRCVPGGNDCGGRLSCIGQSSLTCDNNVIERGKSLCRAQAPGGGLFDGARIIQNLSQAKVN
ncbi:hypothetical protein MYCTH_2051955 [Thermothelomyces thermophilus ATCC 42464]|uniref:Uncharacterized protein n=1 Tax=Thermothelomyces thermophilus (strain ATCC 42464 / BCRC 31852 / DSM 1799) TaxID=573729 RepID=G2PZL1_THET4|nr:uncharacterized protein MYCTH_2051955 [Thermothelomyces thermophilus ATCC 42464]AEO55697.1 hypothetical protein MYCTH_2051955 [Thermothelomyces thermophilus ATCC 42464]